MSEQRLRELLDATAEPVGPPTLARSSWLAAGRRRRRHRVVGLGVAAGMLAVLLVGGLLVRPAGPDHGPVAQSGTAGPSAELGASVPVTIGPTQAGELDLPRLHTGLGESVDTDAAHAEPLSRHPIDRAVALFSPYPPHTGQGPPPTVDVLALGADGTMRRIDTVSLHSRPDGFQPTPLYADSLSPNGRLAAFPQPAGVVLVDLRTGKARTLKLGCFPSAVSWRPDDRHLVVGCDAGRTWRLDTTSGKRLPMPYSAIDVAVPGGDRGSPVTEWLPASPSQPTPLRLRVWTSGTHVDHPIADKYADPSNTVGMAWRSRHLVARAFGGSGSLRLPGAGKNLDVAGTVLAVDTDGEDGRMLALYNDPAHTDTMRYKSCCAVLGWHTDDHGRPNIALVNSRGAAGHRILAWNVRTGTLSLVTTLTVDATVSLGRLTPR